MVVMGDQSTKLKRIREELRVTQEQVTRRMASVGLRTYIRAENGGKVKYSTALEIRDAINALRQEAGQPAITIDDLGLNLA